MQTYKALGTALLALAAVSGQAQILIGQTAGFSGAVAAGVKETTDGARLYIDAINAKGGIAGQKIELISLDDKFDPKLAADNARGVIVSQVFPQSLSYTLVKEAQEMARAKGGTEVSPAMLEGYAAAKVLVEALRRTGGKPTRERIQASLESLSKFDIGGLEVNFSPWDHAGLDFSDLSIITADGRFRR